MANVEHPYDYRRAVLAEQAKAGAGGGMPNLADITQQHVAAQGATAVKGQAVASDLAFGEKKLTEQNRQFTAKLDMDREMLDTWAEQNKWATAIAVGNLGVQALGIPAQAKTLERQEAAGKATLALGQQGVDLTKAANARQEALTLEENAAVQRRHDEVMDAKRIEAAGGRRNTYYQNLLGVADFYNSRRM